MSPNRDEYNTQYVHYFGDAPTVSTIHGLELKRVVDEYGDIMYGLFDPDKHLLISYLKLMKAPNYYQVSLPSTMPEFQGQGWMTYLYDYAVLTDKLTIASDVQQTPAAKNLWLSLVRNYRYQIYTYDTRTHHKQLFDPSKVDPWDVTNRGHMILMTEWHTREIAESIELWKQNRGVRQERARMGVDHLFGPGTSSEDWWNP